MWSTASSRLLLTYRIRHYYTARYSCTDVLTGAAAFWPVVGMHNTYDLRDSRKCVVLSKTEMTRPANAQIDGLDGPAGIKLVSKVRTGNEKRPAVGASVERQRIELALAVLRQRFDSNRVRGVTYRIHLFPTRTVHTALPCCFLSLFLKKKTKLVGKSSTIICTTLVCFHCRDYTIFSS